MYNIYLICIDASSIESRPMIPVQSKSMPLFRLMRFSDKSRQLLTQAKGESMVMVAVGEGGMHGVGVVRRVCNNSGCSSMVGCSG